MPAKISSASLLAMLVGGAGFGLLPQCQAPVSHMIVGGDQECSSCHRDEFVKATRPQHFGIIGDQCQECHVNEYWSPARGSDHSWQLSGAHASTPCNACHVGAPKVYKGTADQCVGCHAADAEQVERPSHADFSNNCQECHSSESWEDATLDHEWPLQGAHAEAACADCHTGTPPVYEDTPSECRDCHQAELDTEINPAHDGFSNDCSSCHGTSTWSGADFEHTDDFPLRGGHAQSECTDCHTGSPAAFDELPSGCVSCHQADRDAATAPLHEGFSNDCSSCHGINSWLGAAFLHTDDFPLRGGHAQPDCAECHTGSPAVFNGLSADCVSCHQQDYETAPFQGHEAFPTTCQDCHGLNAWTPASGGHPENRFSTRGDHRFACNDCHNSALGTNGPGNADCVGCHEGEHSLNRMDREHIGEVRNYPTGNNRSANFCLECHPDGRE